MKTIITTATFTFLQLLFIKCSFSQYQGSGYCLDFNGISDYGVFSDNGSHNFNAGDFTIECWAKPHGLTTGAQNLVSRWRNATAGQRGYIFGFKDNDKFKITLRGPSANGSTVVSTYHNFLPNVWYHLAAVKQGNTVSLYVNGVLKHAQAYADPLDISTPTPTYFGRYEIPTNNGNWLRFDGEMDEVRIWSIARAQGEIRHSMCKRVPPNSPNLVGYWRFDQNSGSTANDSSSSINHASLF